MIEDCLIKQSIICIAGLPCSGKSFKTKEFKDLGYQIIDDPKIDDIYAIDSTIANGNNVVIADTFFCLDVCRQNATEILSSAGIKIKWLFFENNMEKCLKNYKHRKNHDDLRNIENTIRIFTKAYTIPSDAEVIEIWQPND